MKAYEIVPIDLQSFHEFINSYFSFSDSGSTDLPVECKNILLVDDEEFNLNAISRFLETKFSSYRILVAESAKKAIDILKETQCCLLITDIFMPAINGIELITHVVRDYPNTRVGVISSAPSSNTVSDYENADAIEFYLQKPFSTLQLVKSINWVLSRYDLTKARSEYRMLHVNPSKFYSTLSASALLYRTILLKASSQSSLLQSLLRHKAKGLVNKFVTSVFPGNNILNSVVSLKEQLICIDRLINDLNLTSTIEFRQHLEEYFNDMRYQHAKSSFNVIVHDIEDELITELSSVSFLIIEELVSNSLDATHNQVAVDVVVSSLRTKKILLIRVSDNGPGIPELIVDRVFEEGVSTKGIGRGLGLFLVKQVVDSVGGKIGYTATNGSIFQVELRGKSLKTSMTHG